MEVTEDKPREPSPLDGYKFHVVTSKNSQPGERHG